MNGIKISNKEYREREGISSTELKKIMKSPMHYKYWKDNPEETDTPALLFGRAAHKYILETYDFYNEFAVAPNCDKRTKEGKAQYLLFCDQSEGKDIITQEQFEQIDAMRNAMLATPFVSKLINGEHELSYFWTDEESDLDCKVRPDVLNKKLKLIIDYKTTDNAETQRFMKQAIDLGYDLQAYMYQQGVKANLGEEYIFVFIAQEKKPPYAVNILEADENFMASGKRIFREMLNVYKECSESGNWYGYLGGKNEINSLGVPKWIENLLECEVDEQLEEVWKDISGYEGWYQASNLGRIRSIKRRIKKKNGICGVLERTAILKGRKCGRNGSYLSVVLCSDNKRNTRQIHRLIAETFIPNPNKLEQVDHINRNTTDNRAENLKWVTQSDNQYNTNRNRLIEYKGEIKPLGKWAEQFGLRYNLLSARLRYGWNIERALETPLDIERSLKRRKAGK